MGNFFSDIGKTIGKIAAPVASAVGMATGNPLLIAGGTALSAWMGGQEQDKAAAQQQQALATQQGFEAANQARAQENIDLADKFLTGQADESGVTQPGSIEQANEWTQDYLSWLQDSPDITYNAQRGAMEGNIRDSMEAASRSMGQRGLEGSGVAAQTMGGLGMARTGLLADLEGQRQDRLGARKEAGTSLTQDLLNRDLNLRTSATGRAANLQPLSPTMMQNQAQATGANAGAYGNLTGTMLDYYMQSKTPSVQIPTTVPTSGTGSVPNQFSDFTYQQPAGSFGNFQLY